jgi:glucose-6-phosphate isomerase
MPNTVLYAVIGTFVNEDNDVVLDYFDNLEDAKRFESEFESESEDLEFTRIYKLVMK